MIPRSFIQRWNVCRNCPLHKNARSHVFGYGLSPADVLFVGDSPGRIDDILGRPFAGDDGRLLRKMLTAVFDLNEIELESWESLIQRLPIRIYLTNIVACASWSDDSRTSQREPTKTEADACSSRLNAIIEDAKPKTIIYLGAVAKRFHKLTKKSGIASLQITHPKSIVYMNVPAASTVPYAKAIIQMREHLQEMKLCPSAN